MKTPIQLAEERAKDAVDRAKSLKERAAENALLAKETDVQRARRLYKEAVQWDENVSECRKAYTQAVRASKLALARLPELLQKERLYDAMVAKEAARKATIMAAESARIAARQEVADLRNTAPRTRSAPKNLDLAAFFPPDPDHQ